MQFDAITARHLARAIGAYRATRDDVPDALEDIEFLALEIAQTATTGHERTRADTRREANQDEPAMQATSEYLTTSEAAAHIRVSERQIRRYVADGGLRAAGTAGCVRFKRSDIDAFMDRRAG